MNASATQFSAAVVALASQIVSDYPNWGSEHVSDMLDCAEQPECDYDTLHDACNQFAALIKEGKSFDEATSALTASAVIEEVPAEDITEELLMPAIRLNVAKRYAKANSIALVKKSQSEDGATCTCDASGPHAKVKKFVQRFQYRS